MPECLDGQIGGCERELRALGAQREYVPLLMSAPGIAWVPGCTIEAETDATDRADWSPAAGSLRVPAAVRPCAF
jgi:hypothetical protein